MKRVTLITDGSCLGNPGRGGWACILRYGDVVKELSGGESNTTNNRMELMAVIKGLEALKEPCDVTIVLDSKYVWQGIDQYISKWITNGWKTADRKPVKNKDLWERLLNIKSIHKCTWSWTRGHVGHPDNERCDVLAKQAAEQQ